MKETQTIYDSPRARIVEIKARQSVLTGSDGTIENMEQQEDGGDLFN